MSEAVGTAIMSVENARLPITAKFAENLGVSSTQWRVLIDQIFPAAKSIEAVAMALSYCKARGLDVYKRPVHIVPMWSSARGAMVETVWPGISEIRTTAFRTGQYAGMDEMVFGPMKPREFEAIVDRWVEPEGGGKKVKKQVTVKKVVTYPEWASVVVWRLVGGERCAFHTRIYWDETYARLKNDIDVPNDMWAKRPIGQFDKCLEAAALRRAFPEELGSTYAAEEMEGRVMDDAAEVTGTPAKPQPPKPTAKPAETKGPAKPTAKPAAKAEPKQEPSQELADKDVEDADYTVDEDGVIDEGEQQEEQATTTAEEEPKLPGDLMSELDDDLASASDEATVEEIWNTHDLPARLSGMQGGDTFITVAEAIKARHVKRVGKSNGKN